MRSHVTVPSGQRRRPVSALCSRWLTTWRMGEDAPFPTLADIARIAKGGVIAAICRPNAPSGLSGALRKTMLTTPDTRSTLAAKLQ